MGIIDAQFRTMTCNTCEKTVTFNAKDAQTVTNQEGNEWLKTGRIVTRGDGQVFLYCTDACEVAAVSAGEHNPPAPKQIVEAPQGEAAIKLAAEAAKAAAEATKSIKAGKPTKLQIVGK